MNSKLRSLIGIKRKNWRRYYKSPTLAHERGFKTIRNQLTGKIREAKRNYEGKLASTIKTDASLSTHMCVETALRN